MTKLTWAVIRANMVKANRYFPDMPRRDRIKWAIARSNVTGPKCRIGDGPAPTFERVSGIQVGELG